jgi:spore maturation protein CgeD
MKFPRNSQIINEDREISFVTPLISIILTSYNKPKTINKAIESVINQTLDNWELYIMDDNSNLETVNAIKKYLNDSRIKYFNSNILDEQRYITTRYATLINEAYRKFKGTYVTYLTDDNYFMPQRLELMVREFNRNPGIEIVYSSQKVNIIDSNGQVEQTFIRKARKIITKAAGLVDHCSVMHSREIAEKVCGKYGSYWDDDPSCWFNGDAVFWNRLTEFASFYPIRKVLDIALKSPDSFQRLYNNLPKNIPNGILVKTPKSNVYLIEKQERRSFEPYVFEKLKFNPKAIVNIPDPFLYKYREGLPIDDRVFKNLDLMPSQIILQSSDDLKQYYLQNDKKHLIPNQKVFDDYKFKIKPTISLCNNQLDKLENGPNIKGISRGTDFLPDGILFMENNHYYLSSANELHSIKMQIAEKLRLPVEDPVVVEAGFIVKFDKGKPFV